MAKEYSSEDVRVLAELDHIRINPGMYIGDTVDPHHLIEEAFDNALDEAHAGHVSVIVVNVDTKTHICSVMDNGRGIPIGNDVPITISSKLFSGAKFQDKKTAYDIASGLHGVGLVAVNALSDFYNVEIYRNDKHATFKFENGKLKRKKVLDFTDRKPYSSKIEFKPSKEIFEKLKPDLNRIRRRLETAAAIMTNVTFVLNIDDTREIFKLSLGEYFEKNCVSGNNVLIDTVQIGMKIDPELFGIVFTYAKSGTISPKVISSVNLLPVDGGGTHVNFLYDIVREFFVAKGKKNGFRFNPQDTLVGLKAYTMLNLIEPKFSGQNKEKLTNRKTSFDRFNDLKTQLEAHFSDKPDQLEALLKHFAEYRAKLDAKQIKPAANGKRAATKFTKLRDCTSKYGELFVAEGESAAGGLVTCRDPRRHAILPLKGKIPSAATAKDILKNKEIGELIGSLGTGVGPTFDIQNLKYSKIICATDADDDRLHIFSLLTLALAILVPDVIKNGNYYYAETPLYAINDKKTFTPLWNEEELNQAKVDNKPITRFKGLGELSPHQLKTVLVDEKTRRLIPVEFTSNIDSMVKLFTDSGEKRKLLEGEWTI